MRVLGRVIVVIVVAVMVYLLIDWATSPATEVTERAAPPPPAVTITSAPTLDPKPTWEDVQEVPTATVPPRPTPEELNDQTEPSPSEEATVAQVGQSGIGQLVQPDTGLNIAVLELPEGARDPMTPPTYKEAYWNPTPIKPIDPKVSHIPTSDAPDLAVIAAHTSFLSDMDGFNLLYDWREARFTLQIGDEVWLKAESSSDEWLVYRLVNQVFVPKGKLANSTEVWGEAAKPNHLLLIGCRQIAPGEPSQDNFVLDFVFDRVDRF